MISNRSFFPGVFCRRISLFIFFLCSVSVSYGQYVLIPDSNFRMALINLGYGPCFDVSQTLLDTTCSAVVNADSLDIGVSDISDLTGIRYFKRLRYLNCYHNPFTAIPPLPDSLTTLTCYDGQIVTLPVLPTTLRYLNFGDNFVTTLPALPDSLYFLSFETNLISSVPPLPASLTYLSCSGNQLTSLPALPASLTYLDCGANMIDSLPALPSGLTELFCGINRLVSLPALPGSLTKLYCNNNRLATIPALPSSLSRFYCFGNNLSALPSLPAAMTWFDCSYNHLTTLPVLPDSLYSFDCRVNTGLYCLPQLKKVIYFTFDSTGVTCLPDYPQGNVSSVPSLGSISVCGLSDPHGCLTYAGLRDPADGRWAVYPNPVSDILTVEDNTASTAADYTMTDMEGRTLLSGTLTTGTNRIDVSARCSGLYLLYIGAGDARPYKIVKN